MKDSEFMDEVLNHSGVMGMKWGVRRTKKSDAPLSKREIARREKILKSPTKLYKHRKEFTQAEIDSAMKRMKWERELRSLSRDEISTGAQYANTILSYANAASTAYNLYNSPAGQAVKNTLKK